MDPLHSGPETSRRGAATGWRWVFFRMAAVMLGLAPFVLIELLLVMFDLGRPSYQFDPFVGFRPLRPLFVLNSTAGRYEIPRARQAFFRPDSFAAEKQPDEFRIFCLGGSTVQGRPFAIETSFTTWLEIGLRAADARRQWEVVNCGGVSYASYRLVPILQEVLGHAPDLIIVYTGHNEFLEDRAYDHIQAQPAVVTWSREILARSRTGSLLCSGYHRLRQRLARDRVGRPPVLAAEVQALLDYRGGLESYHRDTKWRQDVISHYRYNLGRMVHLAKVAGVPLLLVNPVCNVRDCPPFKVQHRDPIAPAELARWDSLCAAARDCFRINKYQAIDLYLQAIAIDDQHAGVYYNLGKCYDDLAMFRQAHRAYVQAKELDVCPLRILEPMHAAVLEVARRTRTPLVDVRQLIERESRNGIPGSEWLIDHVHPTILGHQRIGEALMARLTAMGIVDPVSHWRARCAHEYQRHLASLDDDYDQQGMERLRRLQRWADGRAQRLRPPDKTARHAAAAPGR